MVRCTRSTKPFDRGPPGADARLDRTEACGLASEGLAARLRAAVGRDALELPSGGGELAGDVPARALVRRASGLRGATCSSV